MRSEGIMGTRIPASTMLLTPKRLDDHGRCCGRKPLVYKRWPAHLFCSRCEAAFDTATGQQIDNWAYVRVGDAFATKLTQFSLDNLIELGRVTLHPDTQARREVEGRK